MQDLTPRNFDDLYVHEIHRCYDRIQECEVREAELEPGFDPKIRAAIDRDRDRAFISLNRALKCLKELRAEVAKADENAARTTLKPTLVKTAPKPQPVKTAPAPAIARNSLCPCNSGEKYKRCCGRTAPPLPGDFRKAQPRAA